MRINNNANNQHSYSAGMSGTGKSYWVQKKITDAKPERLVIWDSKREINDNFAGGVKKITSIENLYRELATNKKGKYCYLPNGRAEYDIYCEIVKAWLNYDDGFTFIYNEEAGSVSNAGKGKEGEYNLITQCRAMGGILFYVVQNPARASSVARDEINFYRIGRLNKSTYSYIDTNISSKVAELLPNLKGYDAILLDKTTDKIKKIP